MGEFGPFASRCKDLAETETRIIQITASDLGVPIGEYVLMESYCTDDSCDCRKVMINIINIGTNRIYATIGFGWESFDYYLKWGYGSKEIAESIKGTYLELFVIQSEYANNFLQIFNTRLNKNYISLLKSHYNRFKKSEQID